MDKEVTVLAVENGFIVKIGECHSWIYETMMEVSEHIESYFNEPSHYERWK